MRACFPVDALNNLVTIVISQTAAAHATVSLAARSVPDHRLVKLSTVSRIISQNYPHLTAKMHYI